ncbi:NT-3 growth factor receptor [Anabarilius grahami]|uniref:NT-3 growth factor receptor n=1 Tax=Anabarilius grahami TaxID=495550 RepID=A0A3N0Z809_ANAGA|nr:NT-3 growth factor receptor [Anabarilius grahami]
MDLFSIPPRVCWWRILFLLSIFQNYMSSMLDCPPTCTCSNTDIFCNKSYQGNFLPLLALQDTVSDGNTTNNLPDLFENISSIVSRMTRHLSHAENTKLTGAAPVENSDWI